MCACEIVTERKQDNVESKTEARNRARRSEPDEYHNSVRLELYIYCMKIHINISVDLRRAGGYG